MTTGDPGLRRLRLGMAAGLGVMTVLHLAVPKPFEQMVPDALPGSKRFWNLAATAAEAGSAVLLSQRRTARAGGWAAFATFLAVYPANLEAVRRGGYEAAPGPLASRGAAIARLPLQLPMLRAAWRVARES